MSVRCRSVWRRRVLSGLCIAWIAFIFGTSCTVVRPQELFDAVRSRLALDDQTFSRFQDFWGYSWFVVVKGFHAVEFAILMLLCTSVAAAVAGGATRRVVAVCMLFCIAFAISDEWHQSFVPDRMGTVMDVLIDGLGILLTGLALLRRLPANGKRP